MAGRSKYSQIANDGKAAPQLREAANLYVAAEGHLNEEEAGTAQKVAEEAKAKFQAAGDNQGVADAFRIVVQALLQQGRRKQANEGARQELDRVRGGVGEAQALLSLAEISCEEHAKEALGFASDAVKIFKGSRNRMMEANALLVESNLLLKISSDRVQHAAEAYEAATRARTISKEVGDKRGEAAALHGVALAYTRCKALGSQVEALPGGWLAAIKESIILFQEVGLKKMEAFERVCMARWLTQENPRRGLRAADEALAFCIQSSSTQQAAALTAVVQAHLAIRDISKSWMKKEAAHAVKKAKQGLARFRTGGDSFGEGQALSALVLALIAKGSTKEAINSGEEAIAIFQSLEDTSSESSMLQLLSGLHLKAGHADQALRAARQIGAISTSLHEKAVALETTFEVQLVQNDRGSARRTVEELLVLCQEAGDQKREGVAKLMMSSVTFADGDAAESVSIAREAQAILNDVGAVKEEAHALRVIAEIHSMKTEVEASLRAATRARKLLQQIGDQAEEAAVLFLIVQVRLGAVMSMGANVANDDEAASELHEYAAESIALGEEAAAIAAGTGSERLAGSALCVVAQLQMACSQIVAAERSCDEAMAIFQNTDDVRNQACVMCIQADILLARSKSQAALQLADKARAIFEEVNDSAGSSVAKGIREHIAGPEIKEVVVQQPQWSEGEWAQWEAWQQMQQAAQQQQQQPAGQPDAMPQALAERKRPKKEVDLGAKLNMAALTHDAVQQKLTALVTASLDLDDEEPFEMDSPLMALGVTSRLAVELRNNMAEEFPGINMPFTLIFDYPSVTHMTEMILDETGAPALAAG